MASKISCSEVLDHSGCYLCLPLHKTLVCPQNSLYSKREWVSSDQVKRSWTEDKLGGDNRKKKVACGWIAQGQA